MNPGSVTNGGEVFLSSLFRPDFLDTLDTVSGVHFLKTPGMSASSEATGIGGKEYINIYWFKFGIEQVFDPHGDMNKAGSLSISIFEVLLDSLYAPFYLDAAAKPLCFNELEYRQANTSGGKGYNATAFSMTLSNAKVVKLYTSPVGKNSHSYTYVAFKGTYISYETTLFGSDSQPVGTAFKGGIDTETRVGD